MFRTGVKPGVNFAARGFIFFCVYQFFLMGQIECGWVKRHDCDTERIKYQIYKSCQYKRENQGERVLLRTHRIDPYDPQKDPYDTEEVDETEILGFIHDTPGSSRRRGVPNRETHNEPRRLGPRPNTQIGRHSPSQSIMFPRLTAIPSHPPPLSPAWEEQLYYETHYSKLDSDQKRILRNSYANLLVKCCDSECNFKDFTQYICP